ncbi:unnamed protein product [Dicrocoelium dendriticum]|nr:unnamed protein product [Dicrocoelium dendriticum]
MSSLLSFWLLALGFTGLLSKGNSLPKLEPQKFQSVWIRPFEMSSPTEGPDGYAEAPFTPDDGQKLSTGLSFAKRILADFKRAAVLSAYR